MLVCVYCGAGVFRHPLAVLVHGLTPFVPFKRVNEALKKLFELK